MSSSFAKEVDKARSPDAVKESDLDVVPAFKEAREAGKVEQAREDDLQADLAGTNEEQRSSIPEAVRHDSPSHTLDMPGPFGEEVRRERAHMRAERDREVAREEQEPAIFGDTAPSGFVVSKEDVREQVSGLLSEEFEQEAEFEREPDEELEKE